MKYLTLRQTKKKRRDGTAIVVASWVHKTKKYGEVISERNITAKRPILIAGAHDSGKSRNLERLHEKYSGIWGGKRGAALKISGLTPLAQWCEAPHVRDWYENNRVKAINDGEVNKFENRPFSNLKQYERLELMPFYLRETRAVLFIDDCHKLSGRKLDIARNCLLEAETWVIATSEETRMPPSIRNIALKRKPQELRLTTDASYDATSILVYLMIAIAIAGGWYEAAFILGGLKVLGTGRRSSRAE